MRKHLLAIAAVFTLLGAGSLAPGRAEAMPLAAPSAARQAIESTNLADRVAYVCRRFWGCGYYGCGWRRSCYWTPGYYGYYGYYGPYRPWGYHRWHHWHHWRHW
ncbi:MAG TPA: hypothetical protein VG985_04125 [Xanthobacteraceae bacterium]|nr:hypothetical protein [Xanthobacteraceae bacterium]